MTPDRELDLLERQNPVREDEVPTVNSPTARALRERIVLEEPGRLPGRPRARWSRPLVPRVAAIGLSAIAIALGGLALLPGINLLPGGGGGGATAVERAIAALQPTGDKIFHTKGVFTHSALNEAGKRTLFSRFLFESWQLTAPPYRYRETSDLKGGQAESIPNLQTVDESGGNANGREETYDPRSNTITVEQGVQTSPSGEERPREGGGPLDVFGGPGGLVDIKESILRLLRSGKMREDGRISVDGREAIRLVSNAYDTTLIVDAESYEPIELSFGTPLEGIMSTRFDVFELLPATEANTDLVSLRAQHPDARIVNGGKIYYGPPIDGSD